MRIAQIAHVEHQIGMAGQAAREAEAQDVECRLVVLRFCEALANFLLQVVAAVIGGVDDMLGPAAERFHHLALASSEEHTSELQSLMRISSAVFCLKKKKNNMIKTKYIQ